MISKELQGQIDRLTQTGSFSLSMNLKKELKAFLENNNLGKLDNMSCGTCLRDGMYRADKFLKHFSEKPRLQMKAVKSLENMTYQELKKHAKDKGIKAGRVSKNDLIRIINESNTRKNN